MDADRTQMDADGLNGVTHAIIGAAQKVSSVLGPGFLEKVYENALCWELRKLGFAVDQQCGVEVIYEGVNLP